MQKLKKTCYFITRSYEPSDEVSNEYYFDPLVKKPN